jgi:hypothetical protein
MSRNSSYSQLPRVSSYGNMPRNQSYGRGLGDEGRARGPVEANFPAWQPSARVQALTPEQIADIRQRLNITVDVGASDQPAPPPIESFQEMVRLRGFTGQLCRQARCHACDRANHAYLQVL